ncbi:SDR family NAD(P)-dependent oxidoreductase [Kitasatospora sp. NBC_00315]|uniref:SDR family NAD(P)-dependent oxidoreductase n=1 Tax=Kitasatospora sp. NBC_00315 TaxID=2975963 RepID=UPI00324C9F3E
MELGLSGKTAVVTGAGRGIGLAVVRALADEGVRVVAGARQVSAPLTALAADGRVVPVEVDLAETDGPQRLIDAAVEAVGAPDILVNNVGSVRPRVGGFLTVTDDDWAATLNINFLAAVRATRAVVPLMLRRGTGTIVTVCSVNAFLPDPLVIDYSAAKAALANFTKALSKELGPQGVRVNSISPGPVATGLWLADDGVAATVARASGNTAAAVAEQAAADAPTGRFTSAEEVADLVLLLAGDRAGNVNGADFVIDGGLVSTL